MDTNTPVVTKIDTPSSTVAANSVATDYDQFAIFAEKIIREQESIIGPIALEQAEKVPGLIVDPMKHTVKLEGDKKTVLENLVRQYEILFGRVSIEICKEAVRPDIVKVPRDLLPQILL